jgi:hypothetical protein
MTEYMKPGLLGLAALAVIGGAGPAGFATGLRAHSLRSVQTAAASVALRFPSGEVVQSGIAPSNVVPARVAESRLAPSVFSPVVWRGFPASGSTDDGELFNPVASYLVATAAAGTPARSAGQGAAPDGGLAAEVVRPRVAYRPKSVLNDAQIASIKERLNLTPQQEAMWPPVEAALRQITYVRTPADTQNRRAGAQQSNTRLAFIDPDSAELRQLKYAALPLFMRLNDDQKREVNSLAYVMGLSKVAPE